MSVQRKRVFKAFSHEAPDRTPLFEIFQPFHPIHWSICGRNIATDQAMCWDAMSGGVSWAELVEEQAKAQFNICRYFGLDMVRLHGGPSPGFQRPEKKGDKKRVLDGTDHVLNERTQLIQPENPEQAMSCPRRITEKDLIGIGLSSGTGATRSLPKNHTRCITNQGTCGGRRRGPGVF